MKKVSANTSSLPNFGFEQLRSHRSLPHRGRDSTFLYPKFGRVKHLVKKILEGWKSLFRWP